MSDNLLEISGLSVHYPGRAAWFFQKAEPKKAVDGISSSYRRERPSDSSANPAQGRPRPAAPS